MKEFLLYYLLVINLISFIIFYMDKRAAVKDRQLQRVPEKVLHFLELIGGVFFMVVGIFVFHHKNRKSSYYLVSFIILLLWLFALYFIYLR